MSKTDKTRPMNLRALDAAVYMMPVHDHRFGPCDLPARPPRDGVHYAAPDGQRCFWGASPTFWGSPAGRCGCRYHSSALWGRAERRRDRQATKRALRMWGEDGL